VRRAGLLDAGTEADLRDAYVFLRKVEHYLQIFDDRQTHSLPADGWRLEHLARCLMGPDATAAVFATRLQAVRDSVERAVGRSPLGGAPPVVPGDTQPVPP
jgi:glutamate-ammonia-ligase adenylyltransferase